MLNDFAGADKVYIACGYTDLRKGIDGLARLVQQQFALDPFTMTLHQGGAYQTHGLLNPMFTLRATVWMMRRSGRMGRGVRHHHRHHWRSVRLRHFGAGTAFLLCQDEKAPGKRASLRSFCEYIRSPYPSTGRTMREQYRCVSISRPE